MGIYWKWNRIPLLFCIENVHVILALSPSFSAFIKDIGRASYPLAHIRCSSEFFNKIFRLHGDTFGGTYSLLFAKLQAMWKGPFICKRYILLASVQLYETYEYPYYPHARLNTYVHLPVLGLSLRCNLSPRFREIYLVLFFRTLRLLSFVVRIMSMIAGRFMVP